MKFLFVFSQPDMAVNANKKIMHTVAKQLVMSGDDVTVCGFSLDKSSGTVIEDGVKTVFYSADDFITKSKKLLEKSVKESSATRQAAIESFVKKHPIRSVAIQYSYSGIYKDKLTVKNTTALIRKLDIEENFDAIIFFSYEDVLLTEKFDGVVTAIYQLDPYGLHPEYSDNKRIRKARVKNELERFENVDIVFTTRELERQYKITDGYSQFFKKYVSLDFPNISPVNITTENPIHFDSKRINALFVGTLNDDYRSPEFFLKSRAKRIDMNPNLAIHFVGNLRSESLTEYAKLYPDNIICHSPVSSAQAFSAMSECDVLLNFGNNLANMVPSKIFDYFSTGKPIINIQKIENDPSSVYIEKYPMCFTIKEYCHDAESDSHRLLDFLSDVKGKSMDYADIEKIYCEATPCYVANKIRQSISDKQV